MTIRRLLGVFVTAIAGFGALAILIVVIGIVFSKDEPTPQALVSTPQAPVVPVKAAVSSVPEVPRPSEPEWEPAPPRLPNFRDGQIISGDEYIVAFIGANMGSNGFDSRQLAYLGRESWSYYRAADEGSDSIFGSIGFDEMEKFTRDWRRLAQANHRNAMNDAMSQQADTDNALATQNALPRSPSEERDIDAGHVYKVGDDVTPPVLIHSVDATYTPEARALHINGIAVFSLVVTTQGMPERIHLVRSIGHGLDEQALLAIKQYRFKPSLKDGVPVPVQITIESNFHMN